MMRMTVGSMGEADGQHATGHEAEAEEARLVRAMRRVLRDHPLWIGKGELGGDESNTVLQPVRAILGRLPIESRFGHVVMGFYTDAILIAIQTYGIGWQPFTGVRASRQAWHFSPREDGVDDRRRRCHPRPSVRSAGGIGSVNSIPTNTTRRARAATSGERTTRRRTGFVDHRTRRIAALSSPYAPPGECYVFDPDSPDSNG